MYYPYLRAKQFELLAVREFTNKEGEKKVFPILEPVRESFNSLSKALEVMDNNELSFGLILNPNVGELLSRIDYIYDNISRDIKDSDSFHPTFLINNNTDFRAIIDFIEDNNLINVILIICSVRDIDDEDFIELCENQSVVKYIFEFESRTLRRRLHDRDVILLKDCFRSQKRNADYLENDDELFTEEYTYYDGEGYHGFSDYATIGKDFLEGGRLPYAVAIHLTYKKNNEQVWIRHFVSDTNDDNSNIQGKFGEAVEKAVNFIDEKDMRYDACNELREYYHEGAYPGLGIIKKISIKNHLELMNDLLINR